MTDELRKIILARPGETEPLRIIQGALGSGSRAIHVSIQPPLQKFAGRQFRLFEQNLVKTEAARAKSAKAAAVALAGDDGADVEVEDVKFKQSKFPAPFLVWFAHILHITKSYQSAIGARSDVRWR